MNVRPLIGMVLVSILLGSSSANARLERPSARLSERAEPTTINLVLAFSHGVNPKASKIEIRDPKGTLIEIGDLRTDKTGSNLVIPLSAPLRPDTYTLRWRAVSVSGTVDIGGYDFTIDPLPVGIPDVAQQ